MTPAQHERAEPRPITAPTQCRSCKAAIYFAVNVTTGKVMPIEVAVDPTGNVTLNRASGRARVHGGADLRHLRAHHRDKLYRPHHAYCPNANAHRASPR